MHLTSKTAQRETDQTEKGKSGCSLPFFFLNKDYRFETYFVGVFCALIAAGVNAARSCVIHQIQP